MTDTLKTISPVDGRVCVERPLATTKQIDAALSAATHAQKAWRALSVTERTKYCLAAVEAFVAEKDAIAEEITLQMGRPIAYAPSEVRGFEDRARTMIALAPEALCDTDVGPKENFHRLIRHLLGQEAANDLDFFRFLFGKLRPVALLVHVDAVMALLDHGLHHFHDLVVGDAIGITITARGDVAVLYRRHDEAQRGGSPLVLRFHGGLKRLADVVAKHVYNRFLGTLMADVTGIAR